MKQPKYSPEQIIKLLSNQYVAKCSPNAITYTKEFKVFAVSQYIEGKTALQIFRESGLEQELVGEHVPNNCLRRWRQKVKNNGFAGLKTDERGINFKGRPKIKNLTDTDRIKRLEIENAYLKAKYDFLVKLRAQRKS